MALYHFTTKPLSRGIRNTVRTVAYRAGYKLYDERTGETFNYPNKAIQHVELLLPQDAPSWPIDIQSLISENRQKGVQAFVGFVEGEEKPHCHVVVTTRRLEDTSMGEKERNWNKKELLCDLREKWQEYSNFHLKLYAMMFKLTIVHTKSGALK